MEKCKIERVYVRLEECTIKDCNWKSVGFVGCERDCDCGNL